jgi:hypothetical protein
MKTAIEELIRKYKAGHSYSKDLRTLAVIEDLTELLTKENQEREKLIKKSAIDFGTWYSGMDCVKVGRAYERYIRETTK